MHCCCLLLLLLSPQGFFADEKSKGRTYRELYELVQHAGNVLPRL
jgi:vacuolar protein sorting-associated protein 35